jgi:DNA-binding transcriptional MocR family regulator
MRDGVVSGRSMFHPADIRSLREMAYDDIRDAILSGVLAPGQRVKERDVAEQMGISTTPVKEALRRLEQEGLVVSQPRWRRSRRSGGCWRRWPPAWPQRACPRRIWSDCAHWWRR